MSLDQYTIIQQLGKLRKFSKIELAKSQQGELVILKTCKKLPDNLVAQERLRHESTFNFEINGLPKVIELIETESEITLIKKHEEGIDLLSYILSFSRRKRGNEWTKCLEKIQPLLDYIHAQSIVHLDIKPSNILINFSNNELRVSLIDFGLAIQNNQTENRKTLFPLGFAAPELILNRLHLVDHRTDYFALGVCIWNCITGQIPLTHSNPGIMTNLQINLPLNEINGIHRKELSVLNKMTFKHNFKKPPNTYTLVEMDNFLKNGIDGRYSNLDEFICDWKQIQSTKKWYRF